MRFSMKAIAASTAAAFALSAAAATPEEPVDLTELNACVARVLEKQPGEFYASRSTGKDGGFKDYFEVNASPAANKGHMIGAYIVIEGTKEKGPQTIEIRGRHEGTVEDDGGRSLIDIPIFGDATNVQKPMSIYPGEQDLRKDSKPLVDPNAFRENTRKILSDIRACMKPNTP